MKDGYMSPFKKGKRIARSLNISGQESKQPMKCGVMSTQLIIPECISESGLNRTTYLRQHAEAEIE